MAPLLLLLSLGSALSTQQLVPKQCLLGPEFWCRDSGTAALCRRQQDCTLLWQSMPQWDWHSKEEAPAFKCTICTKIMKKLKSLVGDNTGEDSIVQAEDRLCGVVPSVLKRLCRYVMKKFKAKIGQALEDGQDAREICISLRMCRARPPSQGFCTCYHALYPQDDAQLSPSDTCDLCLTFTSQVQPDLQTAVPSGDFGRVLNGTCKRHFKGSPMCDDFISTYGTRLLMALTETQDPLALCLDTKACQLPEMPTQGDPSSGDVGWE